MQLSSQFPDGPEATLITMFQEQHQQISDTPRTVQYVWRKQAGKPYTHQFVRQDWGLSLAGPPLLYSILITE